MALSDTQRNTLRKLVEAGGFNKELRRILDTDVAYNILDQHSGGTWMAGGCLLLAEALRHFFGEGAELWAVGSRGKRFSVSAPVPVEHVVVKYQDRFIDYYGASSKEQLLKRMAQEEDLIQPYLHPLDHSQIKELTCHPDSARALLSLFQQHPSLRSL